VSTTRPKSAFWGIFDPIMTVSLKLLTPKFDTRPDAQALRNHNASDHYIGGGKKQLSLRITGTEK